MAKASDDFALKRSANPYVALFIILSGVVLLQLYVLIKTHDWRPLAAAGVAWAFFAWIVFVGTRYRISWSHGKVTQRAFGKKDVVISAGEITAIKQETSGFSTLVRFNRPFRRITIYSDNDFIDVSLKHFAAQDVRDLIRRIEALRPDLATSQERKEA